MPTYGLYANTRENTSELRNHSIATMYSLTTYENLAGYTVLYVVAHGDESGSMIRTGPRPKPRTWVDTVSAPIDAALDWARGTTPTAPTATSSYDQHYLADNLQRRGVVAGTRINIMACNSGVDGGLAEGLSNAMPTVTVYGATNNVMGGNWQVQNGGVWRRFAAGVVTGTFGADWSSVP